MWCFCMVFVECERLIYYFHCCKKGWNLIFDIEVHFFLAGKSLEIRAPRFQNARDECRFFVFSRFNWWLTPEGKGCDVYGVIPHRFRAIHILGFLDGFFSGNKHKGLNNMVFTQGMYRYRCTHIVLLFFCLKRYLCRKHHFKRLNFCDSHLGFRGT